METNAETQTTQSTDTARTTGGRARPQLTFTVHPDTVGRLAELTRVFRQSRGQIIDRLILALHTMQLEGVVHCVTGEPCRWNRKDVPSIF